MTVRAANRIYWASIALAAFCVMFGLWTFMFEGVGIGSELLFYLMIAASIYLIGTWIFLGQSPRLKADAPEEATFGTWNFPPTAIFNLRARAYRLAMFKGIEKRERSASYIVRLQKNGQYTVVMSRPEWANREVPGFATEAEAKAWIAARRQQSKL